MYLYLADLIKLLFKAKYMLTMQFIDGQSMEEHVTL